MSQHNIVHNNLPQAIDAALSRCRMELESATKKPANLALIRDLRIGLQALELIYRELHGESQRPKGKRSAMFTRYVIDEELQMAMPPELRDLIVQIESIYSRYQNGYQGIIAPSAQADGGVNLILFNEKALKK